MELIPEDILGSPFSKWELSIRESFSLKAFILRLHQFLVDEGWSDLSSGGDDYEVYYKEVKNADGSKNHSIWWRAGLDSDYGNGYFKHYLKLDISTVMIKEVEQIIDGKKIKLDSGEMKISCSLYLDQNHGRVDGKTEWDTHPILKHFKKKFWDRTNKSSAGAAKGELATFSNDLYEFIQIYTGIKPSGKIKDFTPTKGIGN